VPFSVRMPKAMRDELTRAAKENKVSEGQELLDRLQRSFDGERQTGRDPTMTQFCFLFVELAELVHFHRMTDWRSDPWLYRTIKQGIVKLLDVFQPPGKGEMPELWRRFRDEGVPGLFPATKKERERITASPEAMAQWLVALLLLDVLRPVARHKRWEPYVPKVPPHLQKLFGRYLADLESSYHGKVRARDVLLVGPK
jgi:hypothetical protein